jgi:hypothetical protein
MEEETLREVSKIIYSQYVIISNIAGIPGDDLWTEGEIYDEIVNLMSKYHGIFNVIDSQDCSWFPSVLHLCMNTYGENGEYFIDINADMVELYWDDNGCFEDACIIFSIDYNDESLPELEDLMPGGEEEETEEEKFNRLINGDDDDPRESWQ